LRARQGDIALLACHFVEKICRAECLPVKRIAREALGRLVRLPWPGNVRQLENAVERAIAFSTGGTIDTLELDLTVPAAPETAAGAPAGVLSSETAGPALEGGATPTLSDIEKAWIYWVLSQQNWHKPTAAKILGLDISTLYRKIEKYGLKAPA
jgi:DNA-binding NtrC family response regulator